jgi:uncharacterized membrane protein
MQSYAGGRTMEEALILGVIVIIGLPLVLSIVALVRANGSARRLEAVERRFADLVDRIEAGPAKSSRKRAQAAVPATGTKGSQKAARTEKSDEGQPSSQPAATVAESREHASETRAKLGPWSNLAQAFGRGETPPPAPPAGMEKAAPSPEEPSRDIESALGARWAVWVGGLALALGGIFLVRYTIEAGLLGPAARVSLAGALGIVLIAVAEYLRRTRLEMPSPGAKGAYLPGILTAAGAFVLFGAIYAAHGIYGFIGPATAYVLLGVVGVATIAAALVHGQALGGLGVVGSLATPLLVASQAPNPWALFVFLAIMVVVSTVVARMRDWALLATLSFVGTGVWCLAYLRSVADPAIGPSVFVNLVSIGALIAIWLYAREPVAGVKRLMRDFPSSAVALFAGLAAAIMDGKSGDLTGTAVAGSFVVFAAMIGAAAIRRSAFALFTGAGITSILWQIWITVRFVYPVVYAPFRESGLGFPKTPDIYLPAVAALAAIFLAIGVWQARERVQLNPILAAVGAFWGGFVPFSAIAISWLGYGDLNADYRFALPALLLVVALVAGSELVARNEAPPLSGTKPVSSLLFVAGLALILAIHASTGPGYSAVLTGAAIAVAAAATRVRAYLVLPVLSVLFSLAILLTIAIDPTIVGNAYVGRTPVFNWLLPTYGIPALGAIYAAWQIRHTADGRARVVMEALATLLTLLTFTVLVRHAMNGGELAGGPPSLAEQSAYSLIAIAGSAVLMALDMRTKSELLHLLSLALGIISLASIVLFHFFWLNPYFSGESTGRIPFFNLLLVAYLVPGLALGALAIYARGKRPNTYVGALALTASALAFLYATLSIRRIFQGEYISAWKHMSQLENYTYSAVWLALGVALLVVGVLRKSRPVRFASAGLVILAVGKAFLFDMSQLEGVLRALSFIGLGAVLIGIGLFYQRLLAKT